jgi:hypothetical protein
MQKQYVHIQLPYIFIRLTVTTSTVYHLIYYQNKILHLIYKLYNFKNIQVSIQVEINTTTKHNDFLIQKVLGAGLS